MRYVGQLHCQGQNRSREWSLVLQIIKNNLPDMHLFVFKERHPHCVVRTYGNNSVSIYQTPPQARKYSTAGPKTGPGQTHPTGMNRFSTYTILSQITRETHVTHTYMVLYHLHTCPPTLCNRDFVPLHTLTLIIVLCYIISIQLL